MKTLLKLFRLLLFLMSGNSCIERNFEDLKKIPNFEETDGKNLINRFEIGRHFSNQKSFNWQNTEVPKNIGVVMVDAIYKPVDYYYFKKFNIWFKNLLFNNGIMSIDPKQSLDCDNFAMLYKSLFGVASYANGKDIEFAVAVVVVEQRNEFGGVPEGYLDRKSVV